jgi:hypothetical protein
MLESKSDHVLVTDGDHVLGAFRLEDAGALL